MTSSGLILNKWRVYCTTDSKYEYVWLDENQAPPIVCPVNTGHTIDTAQNRITDVVDPKKVTIAEELIPTGGRYALKCLKFTAAANTVTTGNISFPYNISVLNGQLSVTADMTGDTMEWTVAPFTIIGALTANAKTGDTVLYVSSTVTDNIQAGFQLNLFDGVNNSTCGPVLAIDGIA